MPRKCKCRKGTCDACGLCNKCKCSCPARADQETGCDCHRARCKQCKQCPKHGNCECKPDPAAAPPVREPSRQSTRVVQVAATAAPAPVPAPPPAPPSMPIPGRNAPFKQLLTYVTAALEGPPQYGKRKRADTGWRNDISRAGGSRYRIDASTEDPASRNRAVALLSNVFARLLEGTLDDPAVLVGDITRRLVRLSGTAAPPRPASSRHTNVLRRVVNSLHKMLSHRELPGDVRSTIAAVASAVPQEVFKSLVLSDNVPQGRRTQSAFTDEDGAVRSHQGGQKPLAERVGLGARARQTAAVNRVRLESGMAVPSARTTRFEPEAVRAALTMLMGHAHASVVRTRTLSHAGKAVSIPAMELRHTAAELFRRYLATATGNAISQATFRCIVDEVLSPPLDEAAVPNHPARSSHLFAEHTFAAMRDFVDALASDDVGGGVEVGDIISVIDGE